jgi:hypothetical protein
MDKKKILGEIKKLISFTSEETKEAFIDAKVGDLIVRVEADDFAVGLPLLIVTEDGVIPASPDLAGEHTLDDGRVIVLDESGIITEVKEAIVSEEDFEEETETETESESETKEEVAIEEIVKEVVEEVVKEVVEEVELEKEEEKENKYGDLEKRIEEMENIVKEMLEVNKETANFSNIVSKKLEDFIKDTPAELEFKAIKSEYKETITEKGNKIKTNLESIRNLRKK